MSVLALIVLLVFLAIVAWLVNTKVPEAGGIKMIINIVLIVVALIVVASAFGIWDQVKSIQVPKL